MADIPDGVDVHVTKMAIAWEILKATKLHWSPDERSVEERVMNVTNDYLKILWAIEQDKLIEKK